MTTQKMVAPRQGDDRDTQGNHQETQTVNTNLTAPTQPGIYDGIPDHVYHADRASLSSSGARKLLAPSCPALFRWEQDNPQPAKKVFDHGHAAHSLILGVGAELVEYPADTLGANGAISTKAAKEFGAEARANGQIPLKAEDIKMVHGMAAAIARHPIASALLKTGLAEQSIYWEDPETGIMLRARPDWMSTSGMFIITDYKTTRSAYRPAFLKSAGELGYHQQDAWYRDGAIACGLDPSPGFVFIAQEKTAPYLVSVTQLDADAVNLGRRLNREAIRTYAECLEKNEWPPWPDDLTPQALPTWTTKQQEQQLGAAS